VRGRARARDWNADKRESEHSILGEALNLWPVKGIYLLKLFSSLHILCALADLL
jgi:hypothetical protein